jgi:cytochrome P450
MVINVNDMDLPYIPPKIIKSDLDAYDQFLIGIDAHERSWIGTTKLSYVILDHKHSSKMLKDKRWHNGLYLLSEANPHFDEKTKSGRRKLIINLEGEDHLRLKKIIGPVFSPRVADSLRPDMQKAINEVIDMVIEKGECDLQKDIFNKYPSYIISKIVGVPNSDWEKFSEWADDTFKTFGGNFDHHSEKIMNTQRELDEYTKNLITERRNSPQNDLVSMLIKAEADGEKLTDAEIASLIQTVLMAGLDTTRCQLGLISIMLADRPDLIEMLVNELNVEEIIEEATRLDGVFKYLIRIASEDIEYNGVLFPKGTIISPALMVGNYDESIFEDSGSFVLHRANRKAATLSYGGGIHYCLGASLARAQMQECMKALAKRMPDYKITSDVVYKKAYESVWGPRSIPVTFTPGIKV